MVAVVQKKAFKPGRYKGQIFTAERLRQFAEGTNKALAAGVPIPALKKHAKLAADDKETEQFAATDGAGWLKKLEQEDDGSLTPHFDVPEEIAKGIADGTIKFTSPEFRDAYKAADGRFEGQLTRHWAFTPLPKAHDQGALALAMSEGVYQFGEDDFEGPPEKKDGDGDGKSGEGEPDKAKNPDMPADPTDKSKAEAVRACLSQLGAEVSSDWTLDKPGAADELLACLKTLAKAKQEADADKEKNQAEPETKESEGAMPFSEDDIAAMPAPQQVKARKANEAAKAAHAQAVQFSEERKAAAKTKAMGTIESKLRWWPALRTKLAEIAGTVQFSEEGESPSLTAEKVAELVSESRPPNFHFGEDEMHESAHPDGDAFFKPGDGKETPEEAQAIVDHMFKTAQKVA